MPPKKVKQEKRAKFQDVPPEVRAGITEYLQPPVAEQQSLRTRYQTMANDRNFRKEFETMEDDPMLIDMAKRQEQASRSHYHRQLERVTKTPGIWETYRYFWDESKPFPDQPGGSGGSGPITT